MLRLSLRTLFSLTPSRSLSPYSIFIARCSTSSTSSPPHLTYPHSHSHPDPRNVSVSVWWDLDKCNVPSGVNVFRGAQAITAAIRSSGIKGPIEIKAFGDMGCLVKTTRDTEDTEDTEEIQEALPSTAIQFSAIQFSHIPPDGNYSAHSSLFYDLMCWVSRNPPPAHLFLIIADECCSSLVHHLSMKNYNILLASNKRDPTVLCTAATIIWDWDDLVDERLGYLTRMYYRPPKCPWYDQDPFESPEVEPGVFSHDSFWRDMETFFKTETGSFIIEESRNSGTVSSRMAHLLQKYGPSYFESLPIIDVLFVVDTLIEKNHWGPY